MATGTRQVLAPLESEFVFQLPADGAVLGAARQPDEIAELVFEFAITLRIEEANENGASAMLLVDELARVIEIRDIAIVLEAGLEERVKPPAGLPDGGEIGRVRAMQADLLFEEQVERVQRRTELGFHERPELIAIGTAAVGDVRILGEETEIGEVLPLRRQLEGVLEGRRLEAQVRSRRRLEFPFDLAFPERGDAVAERMRVALIVVLARLVLAEGERTVVLVLDLALLDERRAHLKIGARWRA